MFVGDPHTSWVGASSLFPKGPFPTAGGGASRALFVCQNGDRFNHSMGCSQLGIAPQSNQATNRKDVQGNLSHSKLF